MLIISTKKPYIAQPDTTPFRWGLDFNHWVPWILHYPLHPPMQTRCMLQLQQTKPPDSLSRFTKSTNRFKIFYRSSMPSTISSMINIGCHSSFRWETKFGFTHRKNALSSLIKSFIHSIMDLKRSPRLWVTILLSSTCPPSLACIQCSMWISFNLIFHHYWTPRR